MKAKQLKSVKTAKKTKAKAEKAAEIPKDLQDIVRSLQIMVQNMNLLRCGSFQFHDAPRIRECLIYLEHLHAQLLPEAVNHPSAHLVPELAEVKDKKTAEQLTPVPAETQAEVQ